MGVRDCIDYLPTDLPASAYEMAMGLTHGDEFTWEESDRLLSAGPVLKRKDDPSDEEVMDILSKY